MRLHLIFLPPLKEILRKWEKQGVSGNTLLWLRLPEKFRWGSFFFVGQTLISSEWTGNFGPNIGAAWQRDSISHLQLAFGKSPLTLVLLKDRNERLVCSVSFCHPAQMLLLWTGMTLLLSSVDAVGRVGEASAENAYCRLKSTSFWVTQISLFWHKHPATERKRKEVLIGCNKLFIIVEKNNQLLPFIVK